MKVILKMNLGNETIINHLCYLINGCKSERKILKRTEVLKIMINLIIF